MGFSRRFLSALNHRGSPAADKQVIVESGSPTSSRPEDHGRKPAVFFRDPGIWAQTDLPEVYQNPLEEIALPVVSGSSAIGLLPLLFVLLFILCLCCCGGQHGSADNETKSQLDFNSSNPGMDFSEENPHDVSVHLPLEEDRQTDMHAHPEECPWGSSESSAEPHQDSFTQSELSLPSCSPEESSV
ncbi:uncharacterized protein ACBT57_009484 isoform 2-T2 [Dama dama]